MNIYLCWMQWGKKCQSLGNEDASSFKGSCGQLSGTSNDIHNKIAFKTMDKIENVHSHHINSHHSNDVMPLQYNTNKYQISHSELPRGAHNGSYLNMDASHLPLCIDPLSHVPGILFSNSDLHICQLLSITSCI